MVERSRGIGRGDLGERKGNKSKSGYQGWITVSCSVGSWISPLAH